ncbi:DUF3320 domain-containing protein [Mycolicibacterium moriokaense]|nr:DUF3320 domain-containing protein [Mycolicibacterium moriokaense]
MDWPDLLRVKDAANGRRGGEYRSRDLSLMLRAMTERLGELGYPFSRHLSRQAENYARELRTVRNQWAHNEQFDAAQTYRAIDSAELLLRAIGAAEQADAAARLKASVAPSSASSGSAEGTRERESATSATQEGSVRQAGGAGAPRIDISAVSDLSYAMAHCRIPVIDHITVDEVSSDLYGAVIEVDVVSAAGSHGGPREIHLDLVANKPTTASNVDLKLEPASMLAVDEQTPGDIRVVLRDATGQVRAEAAKNVNILAAKQWKATPPQLALEMLAAYVQPNSVAVADFLTEVSDRLKSATGNSAIDGYQSDNPERVDAIARAVFDAMRARDIRYAEPPASWGDDGQKIRTPAEVLDGRLGTCLDTTLTMAAVLEQAGINTTLWILQGHAFLGYWRADSALSMVSTTEVVDVVNQVDLGHIAIVETTMVTQAADQPSFADATRNPRATHLAGDLSRVIGVTDIRRAREAKIYPLPSRSVDAAGNVVVTTYQPGAGPIIAPYTPTPGRTRTADGELVPARVAQWKNALLDLSLRNRLINYTDRAGYRLEVPGRALGRFEDAVNAGAPIALLPSDEVKSVDIARGIRFGRDLPEEEREIQLAEKRSTYVDITDAAYKTKLRYLANKAKTIVEETGANNLYLAFGMLHWHFNDRELRSPLVLVPVNISTKNRGERYQLTLDEAGVSTPNYCLVEKLRVALGLNIPELSNPTEDASGIDLVGTFNGVRRAIAEAGLHFRVEDTVHLSILQFAKFPLWKDLDDSWKSLSRNPLVTHLIETPQEAFVDPVPPSVDVDLDELGAKVPVPADSSQLHAVADAVTGHTFVLEGPPGTGKSQTITNLLAHAMATGRRVLFVAEKRAALDVVKKRLEAVGLGDLSLDLHDKSARPAAVRAQIKQALELRIHHDEDLLRTQLQTAESSRGSLGRYAARLHEANAVGQSLYSARSKALAADRHVEPLEVPKELVASGNPDVLERIGHALRTLPAIADLARPRREHPLGFIDVPPPNGLVASVIHSATIEFDRALDEIQKSGLSLQQLSYAGDASAIAAWAILAGEPRYPLEAIDQLHAPAGDAQLRAIENLLGTISNKKHDWEAVVTPAAMDLDMPAIHQAGIAADESGFFGRKKRRRAVLAHLEPVLAVDASTVDLKSLSTLTEQIRHTHALVADLRTQVAQLPLQLFNRSWNPIVDADATYLRDSVAAVRRVAAALSTNPNDDLARVLRSFFTGSRQGEFGPQLHRLAAAWTRLQQTTGASPEQQRAWAGAASFVTQWWVSRADRKLETSASIERWVDLVTLLEPLRHAGMNTARIGILKGTVIADDAVLAFDGGKALASVAERLEATALGDFDVAAHTKAIHRFTTSTAQIRGELRRAIPAQILDARRFDSESMSGQVGGLRRQLDRKRGGMSVRGLMENYSELITQILPCTLMSPDSVARFFPAKPDLFDIVVFDEASQIRVADAVGAMGRANSVVVVGDSKQMPPTSFAETSAAVDEDDDVNPDVVIDEESILTECVHARVPQQWLSWHYRSQDEALIAFSNVHYYNGKLASFPAPLAAASDHGISLVRVNGHFERSGRGKALRTNQVEAKAIVEDIMRRFDDSPDEAPSVGVITFNAPQRDLIENMLRDAGDDRLLQTLDEPDGLFVKNLENVQGDERDTILFSVAFSKNERGVVPLNFGPLSRPGGERRLNVAITRARREVVLYASFDPSELRAEETAQVGTKHLKAYLEFASRGVETITEGGRRQPVVDRHREDIADALRADGFVVRTDVGLSDFRVDIVIADEDDPEQPLVAVLLDGQEWYGRRTVADRDGLPVEVLGNLMHWPAVERVWLPEWLIHRDETLSRLRAAVAEAKTAGPRPLVTVTPPPTVIDVPSTAVSQSEYTPMRSARSATLLSAAKPKRHPNVTTFREWAPRIEGDISVLDALPGQWAKDAVRRVAEAVISAEAPVHRTRLARLVAGAFGLGKVNDDRKRAIQRVVPAEFTRSDGEDFYWPAGLQPQSWRGVRVPVEGQSRPLDEVSLVEISNAMLVVVEQTGGITKEELEKEALAMFGGKRRTQGISARLDAALWQAIERRLLQIADSGLVVLS